MKIIIEGEPKEIAVLVLSVQKRQSKQEKFALRLSNANTKYELAFLEALQQIKAKY